MGFFRRLGALFGGKPPQSEDRFLPVYLLSLRCREPIAGRIDLMNEISSAEESDAVWYARKVFHGSGKSRCFDQVEVQVWLDDNRKLRRHEVTGGRWLTAVEYQQAVAEASAREQEERLAAEAARPSAEATDRARQNGPPPDPNE